MKNIIKIGIVGYTSCGGCPGGIGLKAIEIFNKHKINVFVGVKIKDTKGLVQDYLDGVLETDANLCNYL